MSTAAVTPQLDTVQHPTLGPLKFPHDMGFDERNKIIGEMEATDTRQAEAAKPPKPGWAEGFTGITPEKMNEAEDHPVKTALKEAVAGSPQGMLWNFGKNALRRGKEAVHEAYEAGQNIGNEQPVVPNLKKAALGGYEAVNSVLPLAGESANQVGEALGRGEDANAAGIGLRALTDTALAGSVAGVESVRGGKVLSEPVVRGTGRFIENTAKNPVGKFLLGHRARPAQMIGRALADRYTPPPEFPGASLPAHPGEFPGAHLPAHPGEFPGAPFPEAPPVPMPFQPSDTPAPVRMGPGQIPPDVTSAPDPRMLAGNQGVRTTPIALLPESTDVPPVQSPSLTPKLPPPHIELPPRFTPRYDLMEDKAFQDSANADLERHGRRAFKEERDQFEAGNKVDVPKGELTKQFREQIQPEKLSPGWSRPVPVRSAPLRMVGSSAGASADTNYFQAARQALGEKASVSDAAQLAQKLKDSGIAPGASLEELLRKSIELAKQKKK